jgi:phospholipid/cholesterol/gamma-HCH transport system substrate-binding protein
VEGIREIRVGAVTLAVGAVAVVLVLLIGGRHWRAGRHIGVEIARIGALQVGAPVRIAGLVLGSVDEIRLVPRPEGPSARLEVWVDERHAWLLRTTSEIFLAQEGILGETYLEATPGPPGPALADGAVVRAIDPPPIDALLAKSYENLEAAAELVRDGFPEAAELGRALDGLETTLSGFDPLPSWPRGIELGTLPRLRLTVDPSLGPRLARFQAALDRVDTGDPRLARLAAALARIAPLIDGIERVRHDAKGLIAYFAGGRGTLGALAQDVELTDEIKTMTKTLKREPWRALAKP